ncbi:hypothetical protein ACR2XN_28465, partial [Klebsiella pneumoniae]
VFSKGYQSYLFWVKLLYPSNKLTKHFFRSFLLVSTFNLSERGRVPRLISTAQKKQALSQCEDDVIDHK